MHGRGIAANAYAAKAWVRVPFDLAKAADVKMSGTCVTTRALGYVGRVTRLERNVNIAAVALPFLGVLAGGVLLWDSFLSPLDLAIMA